MPRAHDLLLGAYRRYGGHEDPLTELMATTAVAYPEFARALFEHLGLPRPSRVAAATQVRTHERRRVDLELVGLDDRQRVVARVWSENKAGAPYQPDRLGSYRRSLTRIGGKWRLITIVPRPADASADAEALDVDVLIWHDIAAIAWRAGCRSVAGTGWRGLARSADAAAGLRILEEFISYLEEKHDVTIEPMTFEHVRAFQLADEASSAITRMLDVAAGQAGRAVRDGGVAHDASSRGRYWQLFEGGPEWMTAMGGYLEVQVADSDRWSRERIDQPAVGAGATLPHALYEGLRVKPEFMDAVDLAGFTIAVDDRTRIYRTLYLAELTAKGATIDAQARWLADWFSQAFEALATIPAPVPGEPV